MENTAVQTADNAADLGGDASDSKKADYVSHPLLTGLSRMPMMNQIAAIAGAALVIAVGFAIYMWSHTPTYEPLIHRMQDHNAQEIVDTLQRESIPFQIDPVSQVLLVQSGDLEKARMKLAAASLTDDKTVGLEVLDSDSSLGTSQFIENARYRRGLEGELARTIASVKAVRNARVHLAVPKQSVFVRDHRKPRASVFLEVYPNKKMERGQVEAIVNLVASSVTDMERADVSVVDQHGNLLSKVEENRDDIIASKQLEYVEKVEMSLNDAVSNILRPVLGVENYIAEVSADIDFTIREESEELFNPDLIALRSEQLIDEENTSGADGGIPGALTNQPPADAQAPEDAAAANAGGAAPAGKRRSESTRNYEVDRTLSYKQHQVGQIRRLTVAVAINDRIVTNEEGQAVYEAWPAEDLQRLELLVKDAVGFNAARGDSVNLINSPFLNEEQELLGEPPFWTQSWFWDLIKQVLTGLFILILIFGVLRPAARSVMNKGREESEVILDELEDSEAGLDDDRVTFSGGDELLLPGASQQYERQIDAIKQLVADDPARVAQVVIDWVSDDA